MSFESIIDSPDFTVDNLIKQALFERGDGELLALGKSGISKPLIATVEEDLWNVGGTRATLTAAETFDISSTNLNDTASGIGGRAVGLIGLDAGFNIQTEVIALDGLTTVTTVNEFIRVHRILVVQSGTEHKNLGDITFTGTTSGSIQGRIGIGKGTSFTGHYTIPAGYNGYTSNLALNISRSSAEGAASRAALITVDLNTISGENNDQYTDVQVLEVALISEGTSFIDFPFRVSNPIAAKTDIIFRVVADKNDTVCSVAYGLLLIRQEYAAFQVGP